MQSDAEFLGLVAGDGPGRYAFTVRDHLTRFDGYLYGGTAIAVSITAAELTSGRPALWMTTQFVSTAPPAEKMSVEAEILAPGHRTNQVRVTGLNSAGDVMFASLGATGRYRANGLSGVFENAPNLQRAEDAEPWSFLGKARQAGVVTSIPNIDRNQGFASVLEFRQPEVHQHPDPGPGRICLWVRRRDGVPVTPALVAFIADMVPMSITVASGVMAAGVSLDNTIRIGSFDETEWVLVDLRPHLAVGDYGHGAAHIWSGTGHLLATASQSASMKRMDLPPPPPPA